MRRVKRFLIDLINKYLFSLTSLKNIVPLVKKYTLNLIKNNTMSNSKTLVLNNEQIQAKLDRMVHEIHELCYNETEIIICGIAPGNGIEISNRIANKLKIISDIVPVLSSIKINKQDPLSSDIILDIEDQQYEGKTIIIIDDVSNSGKTLMYAVKHFMEKKIKSIHPLVLVDRNHSRYPVKTRFVGLTISTTLQDHIHVEMNDSEEAVYLV